MIFAFLSKCISQESISLKTQLDKLAFDSNSSFQTKLVITNNTDSIIQIPKLSFVHDKEDMSIDDIGISIFFNDLKSTIECRPNYNPLLPRGVKPLKPNEKDFITISLPKGCFHNKGEYNVKFYLKIPIWCDGKIIYRYFESNDVVIKIN